MGQGEAKGRADFDKALKAESERAKKIPPEIIPMTERDAKIINSKEFQEANRRTTDMKKGGTVKSASSRADGCAIRGKTRA
jgi:hypothetical protein